MTYLGGGSEPFGIHSEGKLMNSLQYLYSIPESSSLKTLYIIVGRECHMNYIPVWWMPFSRSVFVSICLYSPVQRRVSHVLVSEFYLKAFAKAYVSVQLVIEM
jgi:hypothetical protein